MSGNEWTIEDVVDGVLAHHASGFTVRLRRDPSKTARVVNAPKGLGRHQRNKLIAEARKQSRCDWVHFRYPRGSKPEWGWM